MALSEAGYTVISFSGDLDLNDRDRLVESLRPLAEVKAPLVDLSEVTYLDSTVLGCLIGLNKRVRQRGNRLSIIVSEPRILKIFAMTKLNSVFDIFESPEAALRKNVFGIDSGSSRVS